jgi:hypothetical protein
MSLRKPIRLEREVKSSGEQTHTCRLGMYSMEIKLPKGSPAGFSRSRTKYLKLQCLSTRLECCKAWIRCLKTSLAILSKSPTSDLLTSTTKCGITKMGTDLVTLRAALQALLYHFLCHCSPLKACHYPFLCHRFHLTKN